MMKMKNNSFYLLEELYTGREIASESISQLTHNQFKLDSKKLSFDSKGFAKINKILFKNFYKEAGQIRKWEAPELKDTIFISGKLPSLFFPLVDLFSTNEFKKDELVKRLTNFITSASILSPFELGNLDTIHSMANYYAKINGFEMDFASIDEKKYEDALIKSQKYIDNSQKLYQIIDSSLRAISIEAINKTREMFNIELLEKNRLYSTIKTIPVENNGSIQQMPIESYIRTFDSVKSKIASTYYDEEKKSLVHQFITIKDSKRGFEQRVELAYDSTGKPIHELQTSLYSSTKIDVNGVYRENVRKDDNSYYAKYKDAYRSTTDHVDIELQNTSTGSLVYRDVFKQGQTSFNDSTHNYNVEYKYTSGGSKMVTAASELIFDERIGNTLPEILQILSEVNNGVESKKKLIGRAFFEHTELGTNLDSLCIIKDFKNIKGVPTAIISNKGQNYKIENFLVDKKIPMLNANMLIKKDKFQHNEMVME